VVARTKEFDPEVALGRAMDLFWERGYEKSSLQDLVVHMKVGRRSLYDTFGDKHALFLRSLNLYTAQREAAERELADAAADGRSAIRTLLKTSVIEGAVNDRGCLAVNTAAEVSAQDTEVARSVERHFAATRELLTELLRRGRRDGSVTSSREPVALGVVLFNAWLGLRVQIRGGVGDPEADLDAVLALLD
jgi:TetR/AcrR family transcriptional repressor of nem operon